MKEYVIHFRTAKNTEHGEFCETGEYTRCAELSRYFRTKQGKLQTDCDEMEILVSVDNSKQVNGTDSSKDRSTFGVPERSKRGRVNAFADR